MKEKILKVTTAIALIITLTMANVLVLCDGIVSYAANAISETKSTSHKNVEFMAYFKDSNGNKVSSLDEKTNSEDMKMYLQVSVKQNGYFNGQISLKNSNFKFKTDIQNDIVNKIDENNIYLNQINAGTTAQFDVEIEPIENEQFDLGLLTSKTKINLNATYKDRTEKDINVKASREVKLDYAYNKEDNVEATMDLLTNKIVKVNGEDKRLVQISMNMGTKLNDFPIKEIKTTVTLPTIDGEAPTVVAKSNSNTMTNFKYEYDNKSKVEISYTNEANANNQIVWKKQGTETKYALRLVPLRRFC